MRQCWGRLVADHQKSLHRIHVDFVGGQAKRGFHVNQPAQQRGNGITSNMADCIRCLWGKGVIALTLMHFQPLAKPFAFVTGIIEKLRFKRMLLLTVFRENFFGPVSHVEIRIGGSSLQG